MDRQQEQDEWFTTSSTNKILPAGTYIATLRSVKAGIGAGFKNTEDRKTLIFSFFHEESRAVINRSFNRNNAENSKLMTTLRSMDGKLFGLKTPLEPDALKTSILSMVGRRFQILVEPSKDGRYNNLIACFPCAEK